MSSKLFQKLFEILRQGGDKKHLLSCFGVGEAKLHGVKSLLLKMIRISPRAIKLIAKQRNASPFIIYPIFVDTETFTVNIG